MEVVKDKETSQDIQKLCEIYVHDEYDISQDEHGKTLDDYLYTDKNGDQYGVFKLTPRECLRLMGVSDIDIDRMAAVNSSTQMYKQAGNSICVPVLMAIFSQLHIKGVTPWNDLDQKGREELIKRGKTNGGCVR